MGTMVKYLTTSTKFLRKCSMFLFQIFIYVKLSVQANLVSYECMTWKKHNYIFIDKQFHPLYKSTSFPPWPLQDSAAVIRLPGRIMIQDPQTTLSYWTAPKLTGSGTNKSHCFTSHLERRQPESRVKVPISEMLGRWLLWKVL